ncbi:MAG TPA: aminotransferase class III-fold pyridoxal phosphate-dependent enzyme [Arenimonas sp.]|nr:aminotransferase class III-fold pyridoxal phosphate-dependent enzyme [Arenimonas sp.]
MLHSWCVPDSWNAPNVVGGHGAYLHLESGEHILDMSSLAECSNLGHQHPKLITAIKSQADALCFVTNQWGAKVRGELAQQLLEISGFEGGRVFFTLAGADANEHAIKIARLASGNPKGQIIAKQRSYHGASYFGMALSGDSRTQAFVDAHALGIHHVPAPYVYRCPFNTKNAEECGAAAAKAIHQKIQEIGAQHVAAVLMEPNAGTNGVVPPDNYWPELRRICNETNVRLIADEVMSGFGRCGQWFAWQNHGKQNAPDIITCAKGLTAAALPLGAVIVSKAVYEKIKDKAFNAGLTYCGHPMSCAVGLAAVQAYRDENLIERSQQLGQQLLLQLQHLQTKHEVIGDVRGGHGLFAVIELVSNRESRQELAPWPEMHTQLKALIDAALGLGVSFAARGNLIIIAPPLIIEEQEMAHAISILDHLLSKYF